MKAALLVLVGATSVAQAQIVVEMPPGRLLDAGPINEGTTSAPMRVQLRNAGTSSVSGLNVELDHPAWQIVATGGDLAPGNTKFWDLTVTGTTPIMPCSGFFDIFYRNAAGDDLWIPIRLQCQMRHVPFHAVDLPFPVAIGPNTTQTRRMHVTHTATTTQTISALNSTNAAYSVDLVGGTLPLVVAPEATFDIDVTFHPTAPLTQYDTTLTATLMTSTTHPIANANGQSSDFLRFLRAWIPFRVPVGATWHGIGTLINYTTQPAMLTAVSFSDPVFSLVGLAPGDSLGAHTALPVHIAVTPTQTSLVVSAIATLTFGAANPVMDGFDAWGMAPTLQITTQDATPNDGLLDYGDVDIDATPVVKKITVTNPTANPLAINCSVFDLSGGFTGTACPSSIAAGASFDVDVTFTPGPADPYALVEERRIGVFKVTEAGALDYELGLTAVVPPSSLLLSGSSLELADTVRFPATATEASITITNKGFTAVPIPSAVVSGAGFSLLAPPAGTLAPLGVATYRVGFAPPGIGSFDGTLTIAGFAPITLHGKGILRPVETASELDFGEVPLGVTATLPLTIHNSGTIAFSVADLAIDDPQFEVIMPAQATVPAGGDLVVDVAYTPSALASAQGELAIRFDADPDPQLRVALRGTGTPEIESGGGGGGCCSSSGGTGSFWLAMLVALRLRRARARSANGRIASRMPARTR